MVDEIMFSELMGGINNAWYLNLYGEYKFPITMPQMTMALGARLDLSTAVPIVKEATPGNASWYGFEIKFILLLLGLLKFFIFYFPDFRSNCCWAFLYVCV